ncbi:hypothetical protein [Paucimonas lemoignei]|uniref:hypothetical protein n=1 Tax=Paucimonas lemoignei TaxID=29443 RepID=UPI00140454A9|nr:hypothetical protein [Paucimonas lemoignei]
MKMRKAGVAVPRFQLREQPEYFGDLTITDIRDEGLYRIVKQAKLVHQFGDTKRTHLLLEPHILWMNEDRFVLAGFERADVEGKQVEFAQSWLCRSEALQDELRK